MMKGDPNVLLFEDLVSILLQEDQSRQNRSIMRIADQAFVASQRGKGKVASSYSKPKLACVGSTKKTDKDEKKTEKKLRCNYCKAHDYVIKDCLKITAKEANIATVDASPSNAESANVAQDAKWAFTVQCNYICMFVLDSDLWYFECGATKHITSKCNI